MGLNQDEHDKNPIWKGCDTDSRQCRAYRSEKQELVAEKLTQEVMPAQKSQATSDDFEIFQHTVILIFVFFLRFLLYCLLGGKVWYINCSSPGRGADLAATQRCP